MKRTRTSREDRGTLQPRRAMACRTRWASSARAALTVVLVSVLSTLLSTLLGTLLGAPLSASPPTFAVQQEQPAEEPATAASPQEFRLGEIEHPGLIERVRAITSVNDEGFRFSLVRRGDGRVRGLFELSRRPEFLAEAQGISLTPEGLPRRDTLRLDGSITWVEFPLWDGQSDAINSDLRDLMQAKSVVVTYYLQGGGYKSTTFSLAGLAAAAADAYGIPLRISDEQRAAAAQRQSVLEAAGERCLQLKRKRREACIEAAKTCQQLHPDNADFEACLQSCCS